MSYWSNLKKAIANVIKANNSQEITGPVLQRILLNIITSIGENATFAGVASRSTNPGMSDGPRFWIAAEPGIYPNFGSVEVPENAIGIISTSNSKSASYYANDIKRPGEALTNDGDIQQNTSFNSLVFYATAGDPVQLPSASSVGADVLDIKILKSDGSVDESIGRNSNTFVASSTGEVWAEYYKDNAGSSIVFSSDAKVTVGLSGDFSLNLININQQIGTQISEITNTLSSIDTRITALEGADSIKEYYANDIKRPGEALNNDGNITVNNDFTSLVFYATAGDPVQLPSASSVGADVLDIKILKSDGSVDKSIGIIGRDSNTFVSSSTGEVWAEYYKNPDKLGGDYNNDYNGDFGNAGSSIVFSSDAKVTVGKVGHKVLWIGTSIPTGDGTLTGTYPLQVKSNLGVKTLYNNSISASGIVKFSGYLGNGRDGLDLSETVAEKEARYRSKVQDGTITEATLNRYKNASFEKCLLPYINGSVDSCDTVIIDHGYNDRDVLATEIDSNVVLSNKDRSSFIGAFNYIIDKIYAINPKIRIIVIGFYMKDNYNGNGWEMHGKDIDTVLNKISSFYNFMYIPTYRGSCINPANFKNMCPDGVHPHSDTNGTAVKNIAEYLTNSLRDIL